MFIDTLGGIDFAHEATGFLTWHRLLLLWFEREVQVVLNQTDFTLSYWDWTNEEEREEYFITGRLNVSENPLNTWPTYCWYETQDGTICDPSIPTANKLRRCPLEEACRADNSFWPSKDDLEEALNETSYDMTPYDKMANSSFRNFLEGFVPFTECTPEKKLCMGSINRKLHNSVSFRIITCIVIICNYYL